MIRRKVACYRNIFVVRMCIYIYMYRRITIFDRIFYLIIELCMKGFAMILFRVINYNVHPVFKF